MILSVGLTTGELPNGKYTETSKILPSSLYEKWREVQSRVYFLYWVRVFFCSSANTMCGNVISFPRPTILKKYTWRHGRRYCSDEGEWEDQEITTTSVLTKPSRNPVHKHCCRQWLQGVHPIRFGFYLSRMTQDIYLYQDLCGFNLGKEKKKSSPYWNRS